MQFVADAVLVIARCGDDEKEWLLPCITGAFGQDIVELPVRLGVDFIKNQAGHIESVLAPCFCRQHLIDSGVTSGQGAFKKQLIPIYQSCPRKGGIGTPLRHLHFTHVAAIGNVDSLFHRSHPF